MASTLHPGGEGLGVAAPGHPDLRLPHAGACRDQAGRGARLRRVAARRRRRSGAVAAHRHGLGGSCCFPPADGRRCTPPWIAPPGSAKPSRGPATTTCSSIWFDGTVHPF